MMPSWLIIAAICLPLSTFGLQCYTGFSFLKGQSAGENPELETCGMGESCFYGYVEINDAVKFKNTGCSLRKCTLIGSNSCRNITLLGKEASGCCCNTGDFCITPNNKNYIDRVKNKIDKGVDTVKGIWDKITG